MAEGVALDIQNLKTHFYTYYGTVQALDGVTLKIYHKDFLGLVGETGCGKTVTAYSVMRLIQPPGRVVGGKVIFEGKDLLKNTEAEMEKIRGRRISMVFQEPMTALNPVFTIGEQMSDVIRLHQGIESKKEANEKLLELLRLVRLPDPEDKLKAYPHELSGGMQQRIMIAMALSCRPSLLIADEPTTALDVTIEAQIMELIKELKEQLQMSILYITHNLALVAQSCNKVAVMYAGDLVEYSFVKEFFKDPKHPYTFGLLKSIPTRDKRGLKLESIEGTVPNLVNPPPGCRFHPRCPQAMKVCREKKPELIETSRMHFVSCHLFK